MIQGRSDHLVGSRESSLVSLYNTTGVCSILLILERSNYTSPSLHQIDDTDPIDRDVLFCDHLDYFLSN